MKKQTVLNFASLISFLICFNLSSQSTISGIGIGHLPPPFSTPVNYWCGWANNVLPFNIEHRGILDINFKNGAFPGTNRMVIKGTGAANPGFVGIGNNFTTPLFRLDVDENINVNMLTPLNQGYRINGKLAVYTPLGASLGSTYLGITGNPGTTGQNNTMVGQNTGQNAVGNNGTFIGNNAGFVDNGSGGVYVGVNSGFSNTTGDFNTFAGFSSGLNTTSGSNNVALGLNAGAANTTGNSNIFLGANSNASTSGLNNASAIGTGAIVTGSDQMILGNTTVSVGIGLSGNATGPQNWLEINTPATNAVPGASGLRFRDLNSTSTAISNPGTGVLSVDANGDLIYATVGGAGLGNICGGTPNPLVNNWEIRQNNKNFMFNDNAAGGTSQFGFGHINGTCANTTAKFEVENITYRITGFFDNAFNAAGGSVVGIGGRAKSNSSSAIGVFAVALSSGGGSFLSIGLSANASSNVSARNIAVNGLAGNATSQSFAANLDVINSTSPTNLGVQSEILNAAINSNNTGGEFIVTTTGNQNIAVRGVASGGNGGNIGVYGFAPITTIQTPGFPPVGQDFAGFFNGDVIRTGTDNFTSDATLKTNIDTIPNILGLVSALKPRTFNYTNAAHPQMNLTPVKQFGFVAQDVETILPELVMVTTFPAVFDTLGNVVHPSFTYKTLNYQAFNAISIRAIQQLLKRVDRQDSIIAALTSSVISCCSSSSVRQTTSAEQNQLTVNLSDKDVIVLQQNSPNPFAEQTTITYIVPEKYGYAQIIFRTIEGKIIKTVDLTKKGGGQLKVFADDLSSGMYTYSLIVDGKEMATKKMVKSE